MEELEFANHELRECEVCGLELPEGNLNYYDGAFMCNDCLRDYVADKKEFNNLSNRGIYALSL